MALGRPTKAATAVAIRCTSSAERPAEGWAMSLPGVVELSSELSDSWLGGRTHNTSKNFAQYDRTNSNDLLFVKVRN